MIKDNFRKFAILGATLLMLVVPEFTPELSRFAFYCPYFDSKQQDLFLANLSKLLDKNWWKKKHDNC